MKRIKWTSPWTIIEINNGAVTITVPGRSGKYVCAAVKDASMNNNESEISNTIQESIDKLDFNLVECINDSTS